MECRGKSAMPLPRADEGMAPFPQPQLLQGYANADLQKLNAARRRTATRPAPQRRSTPAVSLPSSLFQCAFLLTDLLMKHSFQQIYCAILKNVLL